MILPPMGIPGVCPAHRRPWTSEEDELLINLHGKKTAAEIAKLLPAPGRSVSAVKTRQQDLRERFPDLIGYIHHPWTQEHDNFLRKNRHTMTAEEIGRWFVMRLLGFRIYQLIITGLIKILVRNRTVGIITV
ncbi:hypothetical protein AVA06_003301 [Salmonella enterica subsp. enterica]|nr:hypothetical protein [Salmonella enterica subsp. enterica]EDW9587948.1 hypothetical protein [Salmonella enterica subsp. enterica]EED9672754.1 hypothetical protein [Salmonella enterica subsp. enterica]